MNARRLALGGLVAAFFLPATAQAGEMATNANNDVVIDEYFYDVYSPPSAQLLARLDGNLTPVATFGRNGYLHAGEPAPFEEPQLELADDGAVVQAKTTGSPPVTTLRRLRPDGRPDEAFGPSGVRELDLGDSDLSVADLRIDEAGRYLLAGSVQEGGEARGALARLLSDGSPDPAFSGDGVAVLPAGRGALSNLQSVAGGGTQARGADYVVRFEPDGDLDEAFGAAGVMAVEGPRVVAPDGTGLLLARGLDGAGIEVERRLEDGSPDLDWGDGGRTVAPLDATPGGGDQPPITYAVHSLAARPGGGAVVGTGKRSGASTEVSDDERLDGVPVLLDKDGAYERSAEAVSGIGIDRIERRNDGRLAVYGAAHSDQCNCQPGDARIVGVAVYEATGVKLGHRYLNPRRSRPDVTIDAGPSTAPGAVTGASATFTLTPKPGYEGDTVVLECALGESAFAACPADGTFTELPEGPATLRVVARGFNDARSEVREYAWTVNHRAPTTTVTSAPPSVSDARPVRIEFTADEPATFTCTLDGGAPVACDGGVFEVPGPAVGDHQVAIVATDRFGAVEPTPVVVRWTVAPGNKGGPPAESAQPPVVIPPPGVEPPPTVEPLRTKILAVGKVRRGRVRVRVRPPTSGPLYIRVSARINGRTRPLGKRIVQGRAGRAQTWVVRLSRRGRRTLSRAARRSQRARIRAFAVPVGDASAMR